MPFALRLGGRVAVLPSGRSCLDRALLGSSLPRSQARSKIRISASAPVLPLSDVAAAEVGVAIGHVLLPFSIFTHAADEITAREILLGVTEVFPRHAEVLGGAAMVVAAMVMMTMMAVVTMVVVMTVMVVVVVMIEDIVQETADETSRKTWQQTEHNILHCR